MATPTTCGRCATAGSQACGSPRHAHRCPAPGIRTGTLESEYRGGVLARANPFLPERLYEAIPAGIVVTRHDTSVITHQACGAGEAGA